MPPEFPDIGSPSDWMRYANADLEMARIELPPNAFYEQLCFHAQQAIEKSIKALLVHHNIEFTRSHDLQYLIGLLPPTVSWPSSFTLEVTPLSVYAVIARYPGTSEPVQEQEYREALRVAEAVVSWALRSLGFE